MTKRRSLSRAREHTASYNAAPYGARELQAITRKIVRAAHPHIIILFGSRAYGKPRPDSDVDLMVVMDSRGSQAERVQTLREALPRYPLKIDLRTRTSEELTRRLQMGDDFIQQIVRKGRHLYAKRTKNGLANKLALRSNRGRTKPMDNSEVVSA